MSSCCDQLVALTDSELGSELDTRTYIPVDEEVYKNQPTVDDVCRFVSPLKPSSFPISCSPYLNMSPENCFTVQENFNSRTGHEDLEGGGRCNANLSSNSDLDEVSC